VGLAAQKLMNRKVRNLPLLCAVTTTLAVVPMALLIEYPVRPGQSLLGTRADWTFDRRLGGSDGTEHQHHADCGQSS
jgi:hypothetical protein